MNGPNKDPRHDGPERMLGGYATENLSEQEKQELFSAALQDQQLFDALMEEESLRDLLHQPGAKAELLDALQPKETPLSRFRRWLTTPMAWGAAGAVAAAAILVVMLVPRTPDFRPSRKIAEQEAVILGSPKESAAPAPSATAPPQANEARQMARARKIEVQPKREAPPERDQQALADSTPPPTAQQPTQQPAFEQQALREDRQMQVQTAPPPPAATAGQAAAPPTPPPSIEYVLLKRDEQGAYSPALSFRDSDAVRIQVTVHESGYMALSRQGESKPLVTAQPVRAGQIVQIPPSGFLLPGTRPYRLEFTRQPLAPGRIIGGFRAGSSRAVSSTSDEAKQELSKTKDAAVPQPLVIEILIPGSTN